MYTSAQLLNSLKEGKHDRVLAALYALDGTQDSLAVREEEKIPLPPWCGEWPPG